MTPTDLIRVPVGHVSLSEVELGHVGRAGFVPPRCERVRRRRERCVVFDRHGQRQTLAKEPFLLYIIR